MFYTKKVRATIDAAIAGLRRHVDSENLLTSRQIEEVQEQHAAAIATLSTTLKASLQEELRAEAQQLFQAALEADRKKRYDADEPFVEIISEHFNEAEGGVQLRLDWNGAFIKHLKKNGFTGPSDEAIVDNWIVALSRERLAEGGSEYK